MFDSDFLVKEVEIYENWNKNVCTKRYEEWSYFNFAMLCQDSN